MAVCVNCKKEIGFLNATRPLWEGTEEMLCSKCWSKIGAGFINNPQMEDIDRFIKEGLRKMGWNICGGIMRMSKKCVLLIYGKRDCMMTIC